MIGSQELVIIVFFAIVGAGLFLGRESSFRILHGRLGIVVRFGLGWLILYLSSSAGTQSENSLISPYTFGKCIGESLIAFPFVYLFGWRKRREWLYVSKVV